MWTGPSSSPVTHAGKAWPDINCQDHQWAHETAGTWVPAVLPSRGVQSPRSFQMQLYRKPSLFRSEEK